MKVYLAGPLFTEAERAWLINFKDQIEKSCVGVKVVWPWELFSNGEVESLGCGASGEIFRRCLEALDGCDTVIALLDGPIVDDGTAWEIGYAYAHGKRIFGIRTDIRRAGECEGSSVNAMIEYACERVVKRSEELLEMISNG